MPAGHTVVVYVAVWRDRLLQTAFCTGDTGPRSIIGTKFPQNVDPHSNVTACGKFEFGPHKIAQG